jgi:RNA polymerase sigma-70 factor (ECF subfamily)
MPVPKLPSTSRSIRWLESNPNDDVMDFVDNFRELIVEQIPKLRRYARSLVGNRAPADDLVQDTLERSWTRQHLWRQGSDLRAWLFTIMHNIYVNQRRQYRPAALDDDDVEATANVRHEGVMELRDLAKALEQLSPEHREVVLLVGLEQMRYEDVAEILDVPLGTVMSRLSRGRERLRTLMSGDVQPVLRRVK